MNNIFAVRTLLVCVLIAATGCTGRSGGSRVPRASGNHVYVGIDASDSARRQLGTYLLLTKAAAERLTPEQDALHLFRVDNGTREFGDGGWSGDTEEAMDTLVAEVGTCPSRSRTLPEKFWKEIAARVKKDTRPTVILFFSDGDNDDLRSESWKAIRQHAAAIAACQHVNAVVFCGARSENWGRIREAFAPVGQRLRLLLPTQLTEENLAPFVERLAP